MADKNKKNMPQKHDATNSDAPNDDVPNGDAPNSDAQDGVINQNETQNPQESTPQENLTAASEDDIKDNSEDDFEVGGDLDELFSDEMPTSLDEAQSDAWSNKNPVEAQPPHDATFDEINYADDLDLDTDLDIESLFLDDDSFLSDPTEQTNAEQSPAEHRHTKTTNSALTDDLGTPDDDIPLFSLSSDEAGNKSDKQAEHDQTPSHERFYQRVLNVLRLSEDLNVDGLTVARIKELLEQKRLPQLAVRDLINEQLIDAQQLAQAIARSQNRMEIITLQDIPDSARLLRRELDTRVQNLLRERRIIPLRDRQKENGTHELHLAHSNAIRDLVTESSLSDHMFNYEFFWHYGTADVCAQFWVTDDGDESIDQGMEAESLLDRIITTAVDAKASDIHVDPNVKGEEKATIKYRVDGQVRPREVITSEQLERLRVRIENIARMPKVNQNHPNKGAFSRAGFDWRVQIQPHAGRAGPVPRIVIRRLNPDSLSLERLGYPTPFIRKIQAASKASNGVVFWTGPTGSGKTESIHSAVISVDPMSRGLSVHTIEDPPEKRVDGYAVQMEVAETDDARSGLELLKSSLRADPDVVIFGEVRDPEMAKLVFEAANTGHLVFSTLHTNTSIDAIIRLDELEIRGFLVSYIRGIAAQRLVRRLCTHCRQPMKKPDQWTQFCFDYYKVPMAGAHLFKANPEGCPNCGFTGYRGRIAVAEWLVPDKELVNATAARDFTQLEDIATKAGWEPMGKMGVEHVKQGITDAEELGRVILELSVEIREQEEQDMVPDAANTTANEAHKSS